jgi:pimeloyl-ACP methyl ester carboxylesterase
MRRALRLGLALLLLISASLPLSGAAHASTLEAAVLAGTTIRSVSLRFPKHELPHGQPLQVLVALHGMGGNGDDFARDLQDQADRYGWVLVAPTIAYGDWTNPDAVAREEPMLIKGLTDYLDMLPQITHQQVRKRVLVLGHSRGAQLAHRFAEFRPDRVLAVAALSAGTYTLPESARHFPYGVKDLAAYAGKAFDARNLLGVQFWVGVGGQDNNAADVPRQWDYEGTTRVQRAQAFEAAMQELGATSVLRVFKDAKHEVTGEMRSAACAFLDAAVMPEPRLGTPRGQSALAL